MGIQIKGSNDTISASDGSMVLEGTALTFDNENITGISTMATAVVTSGDLTVGVSTLFADNSTGKTGLGTDIPSSRLQVCGKSTLHGYSEASVEWGDTSNLGALSFTATAGNPIVRANTGKDLVFQTNGGNTRLTILSDGQVTVGSATEGHADADELTLAGTRTGMTIRSANDNYGNIFFSDATSGTDEYVGAVQYYHGDNTLRFKTNSNDRVIINKEGDVNITGVCTATTFVPTEGQLSNRNIVINGAMQVVQRGSSSSSLTSGGYYVCDRWELGYGTAGTWTLSQSTESPNNFGNSLKFDCTTANGSLSAGSNLQIKQYFEGQDLQQIEKGTATAKQVTVSFYVKTNKTGTYIVELMDHDNSNRHCNKSYTVSDTNWNRYTLTFPADTTGALTDDNTKSFEVGFWLAAGSTFTGGSLQTTWSTLNQGSRAVGQVNLADSTSNEWHLTGVQIEVGPAATPFEHRSYGDELARCQRYYQLYRSGTNRSLGLAFGYAASEVDLPVSFIQSMRTAPTLVQGSGSNYYQLQGGDGGGVFVDGAWTIQLAGPQGGNIYSTNLSGTLTAGSAYHARQVNSSAYIHFNAEL